MRPEHDQEHREAAGSIPAGNGDRAPLLLAELMGDLAEEDVLQADVVLKGVGQLSQPDPVERRACQHLRGIDVLAFLGEAEDIPAEEEVRDPPTAARQIAEGLHRAFRHDEQVLRGRVFLVHDHLGREPQPRRDLNQCLPLALGQQRSTVGR